MEAQTPSKSSTDMLFLPIGVREEQATFRHYIGNMAHEIETITAQGQGDRHLDTGNQEWESR